MASSGTFTAEDSRRIVPEHSIPRTCNRARPQPFSVRSPPLLRTAETPPAVLEPQPSRRPRSSKRARGARRKRKYKRHAPSEARDRALAELKANPDASTTDLAKVAKCSRSTVVKTRNEIEKEARKS